MIKLEDIKYRVGTFKTGTKTFATFLVYIDARVAMDELDLKFGADNWDFRWERQDGTFGVKGILTVRKGDVTITREDVGYPVSDKMSKSFEATEWLKDAVSDSLKRCAVHFGIGRELYDAPFLYTEELNTFKDSTGRVKLNSYNPLNDMGKKMIEGNIKKWYDSVIKKQTNG